MWRLTLTAALAIVGLWAVSQLTVATWLAQQATQREADWAQGISPWQWDFSDPASIVHGGSHGIDNARHFSGELWLSAPDDGVVNLSLPLRGGHIDARAVQHAQLEIASAASGRILLLLAQPAGPQQWSEVHISTGVQRLQLALATLPDAVPAAGLQLRIETTPGAHLRLRSLGLFTTPCESLETCPEYSRSAPPFATPESLLRYRDAQQALAPALTIRAGGRTGRTGQWLATHLPSSSSLLLRLASALLLVLVANALWRRLKPSPHDSPRRAGWELAATLGPAIALLLSGWPSRDTPVEVDVTLLLCLVALMLLPAPGPRRWHWRGDRAAWKAAIGFTCLALVPLLLLAWLDPSDTGSRTPGRYLRYPLWATLQQWLLIAAIAPRLRVLLPDARHCALACGLIFSLLHAPNFALMLFTLAGGTAWAWLGQRHRALWPLIVSHTLLGLALVLLAPPWLLRSAEIGGRYLMVP